jgi:hypothetical protein
LNPRLDSARAKWERARVHAVQLVTEVKQASGGGDPRVTRTSRRFDPDSSEIVWIADEITPILDPNWPLIIGECVYNLRCALDHLWWALAVDHLGREPTESEARSIQFPILTNAAPDKFEDHRFLTHVADDVVEMAKSVQVFDRPEGAEPLLAVLATLSNHDKHRNIQPTFFRASNVATQIGTVRCVDCHIPSSNVEGAEWAVTIGFPDCDEVGVGDEVLRQAVVPTGPRPDVDVEPEITLTVGFGGEESVLRTLDDLGRLVRGVILEFAPLLKGEPA